MIAPVPVHCFSITFTIYEWGVRGSSFHGHVIMMYGKGNNTSRLVFKAVLWFIDLHSKPTDVCVLWFLHPTYIHNERGIIRNILRN